MASNLDPSVSVKNRDAIIEICGLIPSTCYVPKENVPAVYSMLRSVVVACDDTLPDDQRITKPICVHGARNTGKTFLIDALCRAVRGYYGNKIKIFNHIGYAGEEAAVCTPCNLFIPDAKYYKPDNIDLDIQDILMPSIKNMLVKAGNVVWICLHGIPHIKGCTTVFVRSIRDAPSIVEMFRVSRAMEPMDMKTANALYQVHGGAIGSLLHHESMDPALVTTYEWCECSRSVVDKFHEKGSFFRDGLRYAVRLPYHKIERAINKITEKCKYDGPGDHKSTARLIVDMCDTGVLEHDGKLGYYIGHPEIIVKVLGEKVMGADENDGDGDQQQQQKRPVYNPKDESHYRFLQSATITKTMADMAMECLKEDDMLGFLSIAMSLMRHGPSVRSNDRIRVDPQYPHTLISVLLNTCRPSRSDWASCAQNSSGWLDIGYHNTINGDDGSPWHYIQFSRDALDRQPEKSDTALDTLEALSNGRFDSAFPRTELPKTARKVFYGIRWTYDSDSAHIACRTNATPGNPIPFSDRVSKVTMLFPSINERDA